MKPERFFNNGVYYLFRLKNNGVGFVGFAKLKPFICDGSINEPDDLWFEFGDSLQEVKAALFAEMAKVAA